MIHRRVICRNEPVQNTYVNRAHKNTGKVLHRHTHAVHNHTHRHSYHEEQTQTVAEMFRVHLQRLHGHKPGRPGHGQLLQTVFGFRVPRVVGRKARISYFQKVDFVAIFGHYVYISLTSKDFILRVETITK